MKGFYIVFALIFLLFIWIAYNLAWIKKTRQNLWLPNELKEAKLKFNEHLFTLRWKGFEIKSKPDRVYLKNGYLIVLEFKSRFGAVAYESELIEMNLRAWVLRMLGHRVADFGYIAIFNGGNIKPVRYDLWDDERCEATVLRYVGLVDGKIKPNKSSGRKCNNCEYKKECDKEP